MREAILKALDYCYVFEILKVEFEDNGDYGLQWKLGPMTFTNTPVGCYVLRKFIKEPTFYLGILLSYTLDGTKFVDKSTMVGAFRAGKQVGYQLKLHHDGMISEMTMRSSNLFDSSPNNAFKFKETFAKYYVNHETNDPRYELPVLTESFLKVTPEGKDPGYTCQIHETPRRFRRMEMS